MFEYSRKQEASPYDGIPTPGPTQPSHRGRSGDNDSGVPSTEALTAAETSGQSGDDGHSHQVPENEAAPEAASLKPSPEPADSGRPQKTSSGRAQTAKASQGKPDMTLQMITI